MSHLEKTCASERHGCPALIMVLDHNMLPHSTDNAHGTQKDMKEKVTSLGVLFQLPITTPLVDAGPLGLSVQWQSQP